MTTAKKKKAPVLMVSQLECAVAHFVIQGKTLAETGEMIGLSEPETAAIMKRRNVQQYMADYRKEFIANMATAEVAKVLKKGITRDTIAEQYFLLAMMPPERTKGNIEGQVRALESLSNLLGLKFDIAKVPGILANMTEDQLRDYATTGKPS